MRSVLLLVPFGALMLSGRGPQIDGATVGVRLTDGREDRPGAAEESSGLSVGANKNGTETADKRSYQSYRKAFVDDKNNSVSKKGSSSKGGLRLEGVPPLPMNDVIKGHLKQNKNRTARFAIPGLNQATPSFEVSAIMKVPFINFPVSLPTLTGNTGKRK
ncbi:Uncharacterised protein r2_g192 [Pycnogonum litorale]